MIGVERRRAIPKRRDSLTDKTTKAHCILYFLDEDTRVPRGAVPPQVFKMSNHQNI